MLFSKKVLIKTTHIHSIEFHQLFLLRHQYGIFSPLKTDLLDFASAIHIPIDFSGVIFNYLSLIHQREFWALIDCGLR